MKKSILILCACAAFAGCSEDDLVVKKPAIPGSEVQFGATAYMSNGNSTRTDYGDVVGNQIELRWVVGDKIDIACPDAAAGRRKAAYEIKDSTIVKDNPDAAGKGTATQLEKLGEYGIQWGEPGPHTFYALYPSSESFDATERGKIGIDAGGVNGYLPVNQDPKGVTEVQVTEGEKTKTNYILKPDMRYAFMVAKDPVDSRVAGATGVSLHFNPLVTALQFELTAPNITNTDNTSAPKDLTITALSLYSESGQDICGSFQYKFLDGTIKETNEESGFNRITQTISKEVKLSSVTNNKVDVTFFVLPSADMAKGDLRLQVFYNYNGSPYVKTLKIGMDLIARRKYYFRNVKLPDINASVQGSTWFSALDPNVYISQLSIPVAGNAFSYYYKGTTPEYYQEQSLDYIELWNKGVRGFEFSTSTGSGNDGSTSGTLATNRFVCNGTAMNVTTSDGFTVNFGNAFSRLAQMLGVKGFENECLIVICTYKSYTGGGAYSPQNYINHLVQFLADNTSISNKLVKLTPTSTVGNLQGKIAIIVRPGDDDYSSTQNLSVSQINEEIGKKLTLVKDWGTAVDKWDKRFGEDYKSEGAFSKGGSLKVEDYLWGASEKEDPFTVGSYGRDFVSGYPSDAPANHKYDHSTETSGQTVHVQEWARIIPENSFAASPFYSELSNGHDYWTGNGWETATHYSHLWLKWPESYSQKQAMIEETVTASMATMGGSTDNKLFINSLCGYYPVKALAASYYPYNSNYSYQCKTGHLTGASYFTFSLDNAGAGGDYVACAYDLNNWFYKYLTEDNKNGNVLKQGPVGLVMLNHIGIGITESHPVDKSLDLVNWIMMNNFKFPLATAKPTTTEGTGTETGKPNPDGTLD